MPGARGSLPAFFLEEARRWVAFDTVTDRSNRDFVRHLERRFRSLGFKTLRQKTVRRGVSFYNLLARRGPASGRPLLLNTHLDTVPPGPPRAWTSTRGDPWRAAVRRGRLYGLGAADVKLNLLCQWEALRRMGPAVFQRPLCVAGTFGEESGLLGAGEMVRRWRGPKPRLALVGEPSEMRLVDRHRGYLVFEWFLPASAPLSSRDRAFFCRVRVKGRAAHSSTPELGDNAIVKALKILQEWEERGLSPRLVGFQGGTAANQVPAEAVMDVALARRPPRGGDWSPERAGNHGRFPSAAPWPVLAGAVRGLSRLFPKSHTWNLGLAERRGRGLRVLFDVRYPPGVSPDGITAAARRTLEGICRKAGVRLDLRVERNNPPLAGPLRGEAARVLRRVLRRNGLSARFAEKRTCTEAGVYSRWGVRAAVWGPGRSRGNIHRPNESVALSDLARAARFYKDLLEEWCRPVS